MVIVRPETVVRWHRQSFRAFWRWKSRGVPGRPRISKDVQNLIREISLAKVDKSNRLFRLPRPYAAGVVGLRPATGLFGPRHSEYGSNAIYRAESHPRNLPEGSASSRCSE